MIRCSAEGHAADLVTANNVLAHVPDINDFVDGVARLLKPEGVATFEVQHLLRLMQRNQFDTIYHEHFSYISLIAAERFFAAAGLRVFDVEELPTHGGSLRIYGCHRADAGPVTQRVGGLKRREKEWGVARPVVYRAFDERVKESKRAILEFLIGVRRAHKSVVGYGAAGKGNTLLNYCGIRGDFLEYIVDRSPHRECPSDVV